MIEKAADFLPIWMVLTAAFGFLVGGACGDLRRHRRCLQQTNDELRDRLEKVTPDTRPIQRVLNDLHKRLMAVSKGLEKRPS